MSVESAITHRLLPRYSQRRGWAAEQAISFLMQQAVENREVLSLAAGLVDPATLPVSETTQAVSKLLGDDALARTALQYGTTAGSELLRVELLKHLAGLEGRAVDELGFDHDQLIITTGSQQFLSLVTEVLFDPGDICLVAAPTYFAYLGTLNGVGARIVPVETDRDGMTPEGLEARLEEIEAAGQLDKVKLIYIVSEFDNPSGVSLAAERRPQIVEIANRWARSHRIYVLEDAAYRELRYDGPKRPSLWSFDADGHTVILTQTFSKSFSPGLRVGYGVAPKELVTPICDRKGNEDFGSANFNQTLIATVLKEGLYEPHVEELRAAYRRKRDTMLASAEREFGDIPGVDWIHPQGGLYVWMSLPEHVPTGFESELFVRATSVDKVMYVPGELCYGGPLEKRPTNEMRLSFGVQMPEGIEEGMRRLAKAVRECV